MGAGVSLSLSLPSGLFLLLGCLVQTGYEGFALSYCSLFCLIWLWSLGGPLSSEEEMEGECVWGRGEVAVGDERHRNRTNCGRGVQYERIYFQ